MVLSWRERRDVLLLATLPAIDSFVLERIAAAGVSLSYRGWVSCDGMMLFRDFRTEWVRGEMVTLSPYQLPVRGEHNVYDPRNRAGYRILLGPASPEEVFVLPGVTTEIADSYFDLYVASFRSGGAEEARRSVARRFASESNGPG